MKLWIALFALAGCGQTVRPLPTAQRCGITMRADEATLLVMDGQVERLGLPHPPKGCRWDEAAPPTAEAFSHIAVACDQDIERAQREAEPAQGGTVNCGPRRSPDDVLALLATGEVEAATRLMDAELAGPRSPLEADDHQVWEGHLVLSEVEFFCGTPFIRAAEREAEEARKARAKKAKKAKNAKRVPPPSR